MDDAGGKAYTCLLNNQSSGGGKQLRDGPNWLVERSGW